MKVGYETRSDGLRVRWVKKLAGWAMDVLQDPTYPSKTRERTIGKSMYFVVLCEDKEASFELRTQTRPEHLLYLEPHLDKILFAGPFLQKDGDNSIGGLIVIDLTDYDTALSFARNDPYAIAGLFARVEVRPWRKAIPV
ncbi:MULTISPECIES: YciI family protein [Paraburkholderia]|uniref:YciI family protein n=1 Tax=Paraburkholderia TaxID=1822464 RepID=UPI00224E9631|nr:MULTISPECIES: YciI family protein [Paraburkholderia]MCX4173722.1 YciI family protein [Paraburkholderia madseniana]MDQ6461727.1 YciI family protein [Paraburkholderia madseniana]